MTVTGVDRTVGQEMADAEVTAEPQRPRVQSAARTVAILLAVAQSERGLSTKEISERAAISRQATYHLLHTLVGAGVLARDDRNRYLLGIRVGTLAEGFARQLAPSEHLAPLVRAIANETGETAYASGWSLGEIAVLAVTRGTNPILAADASQGLVGDAHARASGKLLLAYATQEARDAYLGTRKLTRRTPRTITTRDALDRELRAIRERGYAEDEEEFSEGLCCLSVPLDSGYSPFALALSSPRDRYVKERDRYLETVMRIAELSPAEA